MEINYLNFSELEQAVLNDTDLVLIDSRSIETFRASFIPGSIALPQNNLSSESAAHILQPDTPLILVCNAGGTSSVVARYIALGFTNIKGVLQEGFNELKKSRLYFDMIIEVEADEVAMDLPHDDNMLLVDCRNEDDFDEAHIEGAYSLPPSALGDIALVSALPEKANLYLYCEDSMQSTLAASVLKKQGIHNLRVVISPWSLLAQTKGIEIEKQARESTGEQAVDTIAED